jgi:hypothetical protein
VVSFDDFLKIPGCTWGEHSNVQPKSSEPQSSKPTADTNHLPKVSSKALEEKQTTAVETFQTQGDNIFSKLSINSNTSVKKTKEPEKPKEIVIEEDPQNVVVPVATKCKRNSCKHVFKSDQTCRNGGENAQCTFHPGTPVFHEGSKGWSCCSRKVLEFDEFLKIAGCKTGNHLFVGSLQEEEEKIVECRHDWYQTQTNVIVSVFAKNVIKDTVSITFGDQSVSRVELPRVLPLRAMFIDEYECSLKSGRGVQMEY